jgi:Tol biopolymer transport system component
VASGHLVSVRGGTLFAAPLDLERLELTGTQIEVLPGIAYELASGTAQYAVGGDGTLVYVSEAEPATSLLWADPRGLLEAFSMEHVFYDPRLSPDERAVAVEVLGDGDDIWVLDLARGTRVKLSQRPAEDETPAWSPDGRWVAWSTNREDGQRAIVRKRADGSGSEEELWSGPAHVHISEYTPDGRTLLFEQAVDANFDVWLLPLDPVGPARPVVRSPFNEIGARLSPDGRWLAYESNESGTGQIYVQPFPALDARFAISSAGGSEPVWSRDGRRIFFRSGLELWSAAIGSGRAFDAGVPERLFAAGRLSKGGNHTNYDVARDGRFLVTGSASEKTDVLTVILNWQEELTRRVPVR